MVAQLAAVVVAALVLNREGRARGASAAGALAAVLVAVIGAWPELSVVRVQLFSLALLPALIAILRTDSREPGSRIWLVVPLLAVWSNLHGAALLGLGVSLLYLGLDRLRRTPRTAIAVAIAAVAAMFLTPAGIHTLAYYHGVLTNQAAVRGEGLWTPIRLADPLDLLLILAVLLLVSRVRWRAAALWELGAVAMLALLTIKTARTGVWLLFFLAPMAAPGFWVKGEHRLLRVLPALGTVGAVFLVIALVRGPLPDGAGPSLLRRATALAGGTPILAEDIYAEQVAMSGGRILIANPIDAFPAAAQDTYLDWLDGRQRGLRLLGRLTRVVITSRSGPAHRLMVSARGFHLLAEDTHAAVFVRDSRP